MNALSFDLLTINNYSNRASLTDQRTDDGSIAFSLLGLVGETGSLLTEVKKKQRDQIAFRSYAAAAAEEFGDVLWYINALANRSGTSLTDVFCSANEHSSLVNNETFSFAELQPSLVPQDNEPSKEFEHTLLCLAHEVGKLVGEHEALRPVNKDILQAQLSQIARLLVKAADEAKMSLEAAAVKNLHKINDRWPSTKTYSPPLDENVVSEEQLPRLLTIDIFERTVGKKVYVFQQCNGINIGDRLTDNSMSADDYRFHDVFHLAYVAVLTWSPVTRSLLRVKRKSIPLVDEAEDGARAKLIEEGITTWIFSQAKEMDFFSNMQAGDLSFDLLKNVRQFVAGFEAEQCPLWLWEDAILQGYAAFRYLREHRRGRLIIDMNQRCLTIEALSR